VLLARKRKKYGISKDALTYLGKVFGEGGEENAARYFP